MPSGENFPQNAGLAHMSGSSDKDACDLVGLGRGACLQGRDQCRIGPGTAKRVNQLKPAA